MGKTDIKVQFFINYVDQGFYGKGKLLLTENNSESEFIISRYYNEENRQKK